MKRLVTTIAAFIFVSSAFALDVSVGLRGTFLYGLGTEDDGAIDMVLGVGDDSDATITESALNPCFSGGGGLYVNLDFLKVGPGSLGAQLEGNYFYSFGPFPVESAKWPGLGGLYVTDISQIMYSFIEVPILVTYKFPVGKRCSISLGVGPMISIPFNGSRHIYGYASGTPSEKTIELEMNGVNFGVLGDVTFGVRLGPGNITLNARYGSDFTSTSYKDDSGNVKPLFIRRGLSTSLGYELVL